MFIGVLYARWLGYDITPLVFICLSLSVISIDMTATALNNYFDDQRAKLKTGYHYEHHNPISAGKLSQMAAKTVIFISSTIGIISGIALVYLTNILILFLGMIAFAVAVSYSFGPLPISRTPLGEVFSGLFMGLLIPFIAGSSFIPLADFLTIAYEAPFVSVLFNAKYLLGFIALGLPLFCLIANIMLANNTCDCEEDMINARYTLPILIGRKKALWLYAFLFYSSYVTVMIGYLFKLLPLPCLLVYVTLVKTYPLMRGFIIKPDKKTTFVHAVKIFFMFSSVYSLGLLFSLMS
jgi:1,4-dihydroxy-2-naphthoate octaprenyltransferase